MFLCDLDWQLATKQPNCTNQSSCLSSVWRSPNKQWLCAGVYFLSSPSPILTCQPLPWNHFLTHANSRSVWMPKSIALQNMTALQANSELILFTSKLTEFLQNSIFTYRKYSKQCSPLFNSRHNNDTLLTILLPYAHDSLGCHSSES